MSNLRLAHAGASASSPIPDLPDLAIGSEIIGQIQGGAWIVFNLSGGKDSSAALFVVSRLLDQLGHPRERRLAVHADLGRAEWQSTPNLVEEVAALAGVPLIVVRRAAGDLLDRWTQRFESGKRRYAALEIYHLIGPWSSASLRFCQSEMKAAVIGPAIARRLQGQTIISVLGLRRDESHGRAAIPIFKADHRHAKPDNRCGTAMSLWHPIADWSAADVFRAHGLLGIPLHEAYTEWGSTRLSCRYCIFASAHDLQASAAAPTNAAVYRDLVALEARSTFPFQPTRWLADVAPHLLEPDLAAAVARAKADQVERRRLEALMPSDLRYVSGWPPRLPSRVEAEQIVLARRAILRRHSLEERYPTAEAVVERFAELMARGVQRRAA